MILLISLLFLWLAPGDDGIDHGTAYQYVMMINGDTIETPAPKPAGQPETLAVDLWLGEYQVDLIAIDEAGNLSWPLVAEFVVQSGCPCDVNGDGVVDLSDATCLIDELFRGGCSCGDGSCTADVNGDGLVNISDLTCLIGELWRGGCGE